MQYPVTKAVILAGGFGTRLAEETHVRPKPMVEIGGMPILWHIMKLYSAHGINEFIVCCGYKSYVIKEYFANYSLHMADVTFDMKNNEMKVHAQRAEPWTVTLVDTGQDTMTGGRLKRVEQYLKEDSAFCFTYGDGLSDVDITRLIEFHGSHGLPATVTAVAAPGRFGALNLDGEIACGFAEKPKAGDGLINGGFFVLSSEVFSMLDSDATSFEGEVLPALADDRKLAAYIHNGFWQPMDTLRDHISLNNQWDRGFAPWKVWKP